MSFLLIPFLLVAQEHKTVDSLQAALTRASMDTTRFNILIALYGVQLNQPAKALETLNQAMNVARTLKHKKKEGQVYSRLAYLYNKTGNSVKATQQLLSALAIYEQAGDSISVAAINNNIGMVYLDRGEYADAISHFEKSIAIWEKKDFKSGIARALNNIAGIYVLQNENQKALGLYEEAHALCEELKDERFTSSVLAGMARAHYQSNRFDKALDYQARALAVAKMFSQKTTQADVLIEQGRVYFKMGKLSKALSLFKEGLSIAMDSQYKMGVLHAYEEIANIYSLQNDFKSASEFQRMYIQLKDSLRDSENTSKMQHMTSAYELDKKEDEMQLMVQLHEAQLFRRNAWIVLCVLLLLSSIMAYSYTRIKSKRKMDEQRHEMLMKERQLEHLKDGLLEKSNLLENLTQKLNQSLTEKPSDAAQIDRYSKILESSILTPDDWEKFKHAFEGVYPKFFSAIRYKYPDITNAELRLAALIKLNLSVKESARMLGVSPESVKQSRYRLKKKLNIGEASSLEEFVDSLQRYA